MKKAIILTFTILGLLFCLTAQKNPYNKKVTILLNKNKTEVNTNEAGELLISVSKKDVEKLQTNGYVDYESFGAKGNGKTDDIDAIAAAHMYANEYNLPVKTKEEATYYIGGKSRKIEIRTNTNFGNSKFIIDDTNIENVNEHVFLVSSNKKTVKLKGINSLKKNQTSIDASFSETNIISVANSKVKKFIRFGGNQNNGTSQVDVFIVDKNGNIDINTPVIWDFDEISDIKAIPVDEISLTIKGGKFQTIANAENKKTNYYSRGFAIKRSNVVIDGLEHTITGEGEFGAPYGGFISIRESAFVTVQNTNLTGHKVYKKIGNAGSSVAMGSYDIHANYSLYVSIINCKQLNDINDPAYWGIFASNFCKNILFDKCSFSRFDAHMGVTNATIRNSTLGHQGINAIGTGTLLIENSVIRGRSVVNLRPDYGSTWNGEFIIRNCIFEPRGTNLSTVSLISGSNSGQHNFGYTCYMPERITFENLHIIDSKVSAKYNGPTIFADFNKKMTDETYIEKFSYIKTKEVILKNVSSESGKEIRTSENEFMFKDVVVIPK